MPTPEENLRLQVKVKQLANQLQNNQQQFLQKIQNNEIRQNLNRAMEKIEGKTETAIAKAAKAKDPRIANNTEVKNAFAFALRMKYVEKVLAPRHEDKKAAEQKESFLKSALEYLRDNQQKKSAGVDAEKQELEYANVNAEAWEAELSDAQKQNIIENDPDLPDDWTNETLKELLEETEKLQNKENALDEPEKEGREQVENKRTRRGSSPFPDPKNPFGNS